MASVFFLPVTYVYNANLIGNFHDEGKSSEGLNLKPFTNNTSRRDICVMDPDAALHAISCDTPVTTTFIS